MTTPDEPRRPDAAPPEQPTAEQPTAEQATTEQAAAAAPPPPPPPPPAAYPDPFAPVPRAPRSPWIAPQRRGAVAGIAIAGALLFIGAGVGIGAAAFGTDDHHHPPAYRFQLPYDGQGPGLPGHP